MEDTEIWALIYFYGNGKPLEGYKDKNSQKK